MSELEHESFFAEEDINLAESMAQYADDKRILHSLLTSISEDMPDSYLYQDALTEQIQKTANSFANYVVEIHQTFTIKESKSILTKLAKNEDIERVALLCRLTDTEVSEALDDDTAQVTVEDWYEDVVSDDALKQNVSKAYEGDAWADIGIYVQQIQARYNENSAVSTYGKRVNNPSHQIIMSFDIEDLKKKITITTGIAVGTFIVSKAYKHWSK